MPIEFHAQSRTFHLHNRQMSYIFKVLPSGHLGQLYCGRAIHDRSSFDPPVRGGPPLHVGLLL